MGEVYVEKNVCAKGNGSNANFIYFDGIIFDARFDNR